MSNLFRIQKSIRMSKLTVKDRCETCGTISGLTPSHFVKKNSVAKTKRKEYNYSDPKNYMTQCLECHQEYELLNKEARVKYLEEKNLLVYARRAEWLITL